MASVSNPSWVRGTVHRCAGVELGLYPNRHRASVDMAGGVDSDVAWTTDALSI